MSEVNKKSGIDELKEKNGRRKILELRHITKEFDGHVILEDVNSEVFEGDVIAVIGPSGCGKSTLLNCINLLKPATSGQVMFDEVDLMQPNLDLKPYRKRIGMVFQSYNLFGHLTVLENVMNPQITLLKRDRQEACDKAMKYLRMVGMADRIMRYPDALSGGQKQRVAIARTLAMDPEVILLDEPTSALDPTMVGEVEFVIKKLAKEGRTMMIVTHEMRFAREISNRVFYMDDRGIYEDGPTEKVFTDPDGEKTRRFIQKIRCLEIEIDSRNFDHLAAVTRIREFGFRFGFTKELSIKAQLLFEETCMPLIEDFRDGDVLKAIFEYKEDTDSLRYTLCHSGAPILDAVDELQRKLIKGLMEDIPTQEEIV